MLGVDTAMLYERELETAHLQRAVDHSWHGAGRLVVVEGPAGIGKTALLNRAGVLASESGMLLRAARGSELEQSFPFGVVRQLFEPILRTASETELTSWMTGAAELAEPLFDPQALLELREDSIYPRLHGLYWLTANIASDRPLVFLVDDAQLSDRPSLAFLSFLATRIAELPVLLAMSIRTTESEQQGIVESLRLGPAARVLALGGLSVSGVEQMLREDIGAGVEEEFVSACLDVTAGNPFLLTELVREIRATGIEATAADASRVEFLAPQRVTDSVLNRLRAASSSAVALAQGLAILGDAATLEHAAALSDIERAGALQAAIAMRVCGVLADDTELKFSHPLIRSAIYGSILPAQRSLLHAEAARLLNQYGADAEHVAAQVLLAGGLSEPWVSEQLLVAADAALAMGAPESAVAYLQRALDLTSTSAERARLLGLLGHAEVLAGVPEAVDHLQEAVRTTSDPDERARVAIVLSELLRFTGRCAAAVELITMLPAAASSDLNVLLDNELLMTTVMSESAHAALASRVRELRDPGRGAADESESLHLILLAHEAMLDNTPKQEVVYMLERAAPHPRPRQHRIMLTPGIITAGYTYGFCDELDAADALIDPVIAECERRGALVPLVVALGVRAEIGYRRGRLFAALADAERGWRLSGEFSPDMAPLGILALAVIASVAVERELPDSELEALLRDVERLSDPDSLNVHLVLLARARLLVTLERPQDALEQLRTFAQLPRTFAGGAPGAIAWRSAAALILARLGETEEARSLAEQELELARAMGGLRATGIALHARALIGSPVELERLEEAVNVLRGSGARLEYARALVDFGCALRRGGERAAAREPLREGHNEALRCGAAKLASRARQDLAATGERMTSGDLTGVASLTASERRVAEMAASGDSNRDIAQALFVTEKTVEAHLGHVYDKLGVRSRHKLAGLLERDEPSLQGSS